MKNNCLLIFVFLIFTISGSAQTYTDSTLAQVVAKDKVNRDSAGILRTLSSEEHFFRADVYMSNRQFPQAREHWQKVIKNYPTHVKIPKVLFGMGRSNMWERKYQMAIFWFDKLVKSHSSSFYGREGLAYKGASYVRLGKSLEAAKTYEQYTVMFPFGKRIASSFLNIIDAYREAGQYDNANLWVDKARKRFSRTTTEMNALHARLRMEIFRKNWTGVISAANDLASVGRFKGSMAYEHEVTYLKAYAFEMRGQKSRARGIYSSIPATPTSYYSGLATDKIMALGGNARYRNNLVKSASRRMARSYPVRYRFGLLRHAKSRGIDPRFVLAIMKQESSFRARAKSPAAARGLLQLTYDTALKYNKRAGFYSIKGTDLYRPNVNIAIGSVYISDLKKQFEGLYEAVAASYNGGEDNSARWLAKSQPKTPAIFASEVGFSETKKYVFKVMTNFRIYKELYTANLTRK